MHILRKYKVEFVEELLHLADSSKREGNFLRKIAAELRY
jgi:hypothetical protein